MIRKIAVWWSEAMVANGAPEDEKEVYIYALECSLNELASDLLLIVMAAVLGRVWEMLVWIAVFNLLRLNVGGYHASTPFRCILLSTMLGVVCTLVYPALNGRWMLISVMALFCTAAVFWVAPVLNQNHPLSQERQEKAKRKARIMAVTITAVICALMIGGNRELTSMITVSFSSVILLSILAKALQQKNPVVFTEE